MQSCETDNAGGGCPKFATNYHILSESAVSQTPYFTNKSFDTLSFVSNKGDTLTFVKTKTDTIWYCEDDNSNPNCPKEKANCYQTLHNTYNTIKGVGSFDVRHVLKDYEVFQLIEVRFNDFATSINDFNLNETRSPTYVESIILLNKPFTKVTRVTLNNGNQNTAITYFNQKCGLLYFEDLINNTKWIIL